MTSGFVSEKDIGKLGEKDNKIASSNSAKVGDLYDQLQKRKELEEQAEKKEFEELAEKNEDDKRYIEDMLLKEKEKELEERANEKILLSQFYQKQITENLPDSLELLRNKPKNKDKSSVGILDTKVEKKRKVDMSIQPKIIPKKKKDISLENNKDTKKEDDKNKKNVVKKSNTTNLSSLFDY